MTDPRSDARHLALRLVHEMDGSGVVPRLTRDLGVSRQVANGYLQSLVADGLLEADGSTRARRYRLAVLAQGSRTYEPSGLEEHLVWREAIAPVVVDLRENIRRIWQYALTEMVNNAIDHADATTITVTHRMTGFDMTVQVQDDGEGIFHKIQRSLGLTDPRQSILELAKGKLTTAPTHHSGEGIFFTSRMLDRFDIRSGDLHFVHRLGKPDVIPDVGETITGTLITMNLSNQTQRTTASVFDQFADPDEATFDRTIVPVKLAQEPGEFLVSRSQARRISTRFDRFRHVQIDFDGVDEIGQAFADELFRVFPLEHPDVRVVPINTAPTVARMISRVTAGANGG